MVKFIIFCLVFINVLNAKEPISPIPLHVDYNLQKAKLGMKLFLDPILSGDNSVACVKCHDIYEGGADKNVVSSGFHGKKGNIQSPTVFNARYNFTQFWNGRAKDLLEQAKGPLANPVEHNISPKEIEKKLNNSEEYKKLFKKVYGKKKITYEKVLDAIVEFENALVTPNSKFDNYLRGKTQLSKKEMNGYVTFKKIGCITCHNGINIGGNSFQKMGTFIKYDTNKTYPDRYEVTKHSYDKNVFKVPTLRNISKTTPYFHDGSSKTLKDAIKKMTYYNLGVELDEKTIDDLVAFLKTLNGEKPKILGEKW